MILSGQSLVDTLRSKCDKVQRRIWIISPFIGEFNDVQKIIGNQWAAPHIDFRVLTDIKHGFLKKSTFTELLQNKVSIRSLPSIHAKVYIVDDYCLITSANLTGTAFAKRYEIGLESRDLRSIETLFSYWWNIAEKVTSYHRSSQANFGYERGDFFSTKFDLPKKSKETKTSKYLKKCNLYLDFAKMYQDVTGRSIAMKDAGCSLFQEVDYFFNYIYHDHKEQPSFKLKKTRTLSDKQQKTEIRKYFKCMIDDFEQNDGQSEIARRIKFSRTLKRKLSQSAINTLTLKDVEDIIKRFHCYHSYPLNITRFLNSNKLADIKKNWKILLHTYVDKKVTQAEIDEVQNNLRYFGPSATQELIAWYYPDNYPMMNSNSDCGMKFFGYKLN